MEDDADNDQHLASHNGEHTYDVHAAQLTENIGTDRIKRTSEDLVEGTPSNHKPDESETYSDPDQPAGLRFVAATVWRKLSRSCRMWLTYAYWLPATLLMFPACWFSISYCPCMSSSRGRGSGGT